MLIRVFVGRKIAFFPDEAQMLSYEPCHKKASLRGFRQSPTGLYNHRRWLETLNFGFSKLLFCLI